MATLSESIDALARKVAEDQIAQDIEFNAKLQKQEQSFSMLLTLEARVKRLIDIAWVEEKVEPLSLSVTSTTSGAFLVRLGALERKVEELESKVWKHKE